MHALTPNGHYQHIHTHMDTHACMTSVWTEHHLMFGCQVGRGSPAIGDCEAVTTMNEYTSATIAYNCFHTLAKLME